MNDIKSPRAVGCYTQSSFFAPLFMLIVLYCFVTLFLNVSCSNVMDDSSVCFSSFSGLRGIMWKMWLQWCERRKGEIFLMCHCQINTGVGLQSMWRAVLAKQQSWQCSLFNLIQFSLFCIAHYHKIQICLRGLYNLYTYDIPDLWPHIGSGKTPKKSKKTKRMNSW